MVRSGLNDVNRLSGYKDTSRYLRCDIHIYIIIYIYTYIYIYHTNKILIVLGKVGTEYRLGYPQQQGCLGMNCYHLYNGSIVILGSILSAILQFNNVHHE